MEVMNDKGCRDRRLYRRRGGMLGGVCGGLADYLGIGVGIVRLLAIISLFCGSLGFWIYVVMWLIIPKEPLRRYYR